MKMLMCIIVIFAVAETAIGGYRMPCTDDCSCKNYTCMMDAATSVCGYIQLEDQAIEKHCKCILCEQNSNDDSDDTDSRRRSTESSCQNDCDCRGMSCTDSQIGYCNKEKEDRWTCGCKSCKGYENSYDSSNDDDDGDD